MKTKIAVLGSTGMAGSLISHYFKLHGYNVTRYSRTFIPNHTDVLFNAHNEDSLNKLASDILNGRIDVIINCIGYLVKDSRRIQLRQHI